MSTQSPLRTGQTTISEPTAVVFKRFLSNNEIIALFPYELSDYNGFYCMSYLHVGQHGGAHLPPAKTVSATPAEYMPLYRELRTLGYQLRVLTKCPSLQHAFAVRRAQL